VEQTKNDKNELLKNVSNKIDDMFTKHWIKYYHICNPVYYETIEGGSDAYYDYKTAEIISHISCDLGKGM
jgi:hypothetical protein